MRHVTLVLALVFTVALAIPAIDTHPQEDPVLKILKSEPGWGPYADPNG